MACVSDYGFPSDGSEFEVELRFPQEDFDRFAELSGDDNPIHVDPAFAATTRFGHTVAHGMLLFAVANAAINRWIGGRLNLHEQQLVFPAPTFPGEEVSLSLTIQPDQEKRRRRIDLVMVTSSGETCRGRALVGFDDLIPHRSPLLIVPAETLDFKGLRVGMQADRVRVLDESDVHAFVDLTADPHPGYADSPPIVPPALLAGAISDLLGVSLPGPGSNWLKQTYRFHRHVRAGERIRSSVEISRLRPAKQLANLRTDLAVRAGTVVSGEALLLVSDVSDRSGGGPGGSDEGA
ncbi:MAG: MaoC/PaaZ C-terminal domain-containing protein [Acidimicrobiia bacterium]